MYQLSYLCETFIHLSCWDEIILTQKKLLCLDEILRVFSSLIRGFGLNLSLNFVLTHMDLTYDFSKVMTMSL
jgi:hypothetical protein